MRLNSGYVKYNIAFSLDADVAGQVAEPHPRDPRPKEADQDQNGAQNNQPSRHGVEAAPWGGRQSLLGVSPRNEHVKRQQNERGENDVESVAIHCVLHCCISEIMVDFLCTGKTNHNQYRFQYNTVSVMC